MSCYVAGKRKMRLDALPAPLKKVMLRTSNFWSRILCESLANIQEEFRCQFSIEQAREVIYPSYQKQIAMR
jgi:hypothetical protein